MVCNAQLRTGIIYPGVDADYLEHNKLSRTVLFVPDESVDDFSQAFFWEDFFSIHGLSELDRVDEFLAEVAEVKAIAADSSAEFTVEDDRLCLSGSGEHCVEVYSLTGACLLRQKCAEGTLILPRGAGIVVVDGISRKVIVR